MIVKCLNILKINPPDKQYAKIQNQTNNWDLYLELH